MSVKTRKVSFEVSASKTAEPRTLTVEIPATPQGWTAWGWDVSEKLFSGSSIRVDCQGYVRRQVNAKSDPLPYTAEAMTAAAQAYLQSGGNGRSTVQTVTLDPELFDDEAFERMQADNPHVRFVRPSK